MRWDGPNYLLKKWLCGQGKLPKIMGLANKMGWVFSLGLPI
tara:strand:- start:78 stop:200 length:123 start_codon:yes stop_codon:yes gene_type:complete